MGAKTKVHNIRDVFYDRNLIEGAVPVKQVDGTFAIKNFTIIKAGLSKNKNFYPEKTLRKAAKVFEGVDIRTDHPSFFASQSVNDVVGRITKTWYSRESKAIKGDALFSSTAEDILTKVQEGFIGDMSINARGETQHEEGPDGNVRRIVKSIDEGFSVDLVCDAAAGGSLHEDFRKHSLIIENVRKQMEELENITEEELRKARPDLVESVEKKVLAENADDGKKTEDPAPAPSVTKDEIGAVVKEQINSLFKERDEKADSEASAKALEEAIASAVDDVLKESDVDDAVKVFVRENLIPFAKENFDAIDKIDAKKLSEERDAVLKHFTELASKLSENSQPGSPKGGKEKSKAGIMSYLPQ